jgi:hypothetical protein
MALDDFMEPGPTTPDLVVVRTQFDVGDKVFGLSQAFAPIFKYGTYSLKFRGFAHSYVSLLGRHVGQLTPSSCAIPLRSYNVLPWANQS